MNEFAQKASGAKRNGRFRSSQKYSTTTKKTNVEEKNGERF